MNVETNSAHPAAGRRPLAMILVVDDDPDALTTLHLVLSMLGFDAVAARSAREALQRIEERLPDLIITDSAMPSMSGLELCRVLRASQRTRRIPIVLHTGMDVPDDVPRLYDRIITKPAEIDAVVRLIRELLPPDAAGVR
ncbi:MAG TPA: response regulator [Steroidobacteraceae bacterium]|nr:response regulator [Steroidobacteraceae bacterium]